MSYLFIGICIFNFCDEVSTIVNISYDKKMHHATVLRLDGFSANWTSRLVWSTAPGSVEHLKEIEHVRVHA